MIICGYDFKVPSWWDELDAELPQDLHGEEAVRDYIRQKCGADVGTESTWPEAMKLSVQYDMRINGLPVYIGHCYKKGRQFAEAASAYSAMHALAGDSEWYGCYLALQAGHAYRDAGDEAEARRFFEIAAGYVDSPDGAVSYYAELAANALK